MAVIEVLDTHTNQSTAQRRDTSCTGALMALRTMIMRTRAALGTEALATLAAVEVSLARICQVMCKVWLC